MGYLKVYSTFRAAFYRIFARLPCVAAGALAVKELRSVLTSLKLRFSFAETSLRSVLTSLKLRFQVALSLVSPTKAAACGTLAPVLSIGGKA